MDKGKAPMDPHTPRETRGAPNVEDPLLVSHSPRSVLEQESETDSDLEMWEPRREPTTITRISSGEEEEEEDWRFDYDMYGYGD